MDQKDVIGTHEENHELELDVQAVHDLQNQTAALQSVHSDERDLLNQMMGQIQMTGAISKLTTVVGLTKLAHIKESKMYRALAGKSGLDRNGNEIADVGTWEGFCLAVGTTRQKADEDILNLKVFGETALEDLSRVGAGYREMRQFRKLPEDQKTALIEVAKTGDKESFVDLAEEIISKHAKEKEQLIKERDDAQADKAAVDQVLADKSSKIDELEKQVSRKRLEHLPPDEESQQLREEANNLLFDAEASIRQLVQPLDQVMNHATEHGIDIGHWMRGQLDQLNDAVEYLREQLGMVSWQPVADPDIEGEQWTGQAIDAERSVQ